MASGVKSLFQVGPGSELELPVRAFRSVLLLAQRLRYLMDDRLRADGLTTQQAALLTAVAAFGRPSLTEMAAVLGTSHQNVRQLVTALRRKGFLRIEADPADKRRRLLVTTDANERFWSSRDEGDITALAEWFATLSPKELQMLCGLIDRLLSGLVR